MDYPSDEPRQNEKKSPLLLSGAIKRSDETDFAALSVHYLETVFLKKEIEDDQQLTEYSTIYEIENLKKEDEPGLIRRKGLNRICPIDGKLGASYVHCVTGADYVGTATHMLSYTWG
mgnify:CR=1 FL=1